MVFITGSRAHWPLDEPVEGEVAVGRLADSLPKDVIRVPYGQTEHMVRAWKASYSRFALFNADMLGGPM